MKSLFFGTSTFAVPSLEAVARRTQLAGVVTQPDRPAGRGHKLTASPVKSSAEKLGVRIYQPQSLRDFPRELAGQSFDVFVVASYGKIVPQELLALPKLGALNVHPSLLPKYRGATPIQTALRDGATETGVTIMLMDAGMDTGDIVLQEHTPILPDETYGELHDRLAHLGSQALLHALDSTHDGIVPRIPQTGEVSVTKPMTKADLEIDWKWPAERIVNTVRAYSPQPAARATLANLRVKLIRVSHREEPLRLRSGQAPDRERPRVITRGVGDTIGTRGDAIIVKCGDGAVEVLQLIAPNGPLQTGAQFATAIES